MKKMVNIVAPLINLFKNKVVQLPYEENKRTIGTEGEQLAMKFLKKSGYTILQRNYRCKRGEIDVVCYDHGTIAFVEVKTRYSEKYGPPELSVTDAKKNQIIKVALYYIAEKKIEGIDLRFDVVSVSYSPVKKQPTITLFKNAFFKNDSVTSRI